ncbi:MAG: sulfite exporter TauE/SafE family protein [Alphaproteobacteria bacterium]|nr:sulfite exporter TauE/SafE family protein [Alphaproteobacteria bacterium]
MNELVQYLPDLAMLICAGMVGGFIAGLFGVGGGTITVPVLYYWFTHMGISPEVAMHVSVGTSLATIIATSLSSSRAHEKRGSVDQDILKIWGPPIAVGAVMGALIAGVMSGTGMRLAFGGFLIFVALYMLIGKDGAVLRNSLPSIWAQRFISWFIGTFSSIVGVGGGALSVPTLAACNVPMQRAVGTSSAFGVIIAMPGAAGFIISGWGHEGLPPYSLGFVNLMALVVLLPTTALLAPVGAKVAHFLSRQLLRRIFGAFLLFIAAKMLYGVLSV